MSMPSFRRWGPWLWVLAAHTPVGATTPITLEALEREAQADGALVAMALFCQLPTDDIRTLQRQREAKALQQAHDQGLTFDTGAFQRHAVQGLQSMASLLRHMERTGPRYERECAEVKTKVYGDAF